MASDEVLIQTAISLLGTGDKARRHTMFELFRGATISGGRAWKKPHLVPLGTPHRRKRCDVQRLAVGRAATPGTGRRLHRATGPIRPASNLHRDCQVLGGRSHRAPFEIQDFQL
jgi:hypothetical protein